MASNGDGGELSLLRLLREGEGGGKREMRAHGVTGERRGMKWHVEARRGLTGGAGGVEWPPCGGQTLRRLPTDGQADSAIRASDPSLTSCFGNDQSPNLQHISTSYLNKSCSPIYHLQFLLKDQGLILNE